MRIPHKCNKRCNNDTWQRMQQSNLLVALRLWTFFPEVRMRGSKLNLMKKQEEWRLENWSGARSDMTANPCTIPTRLALKSISGISAMRNCTASNTQASGCHLPPSPISECEWMHMYTYGVPIPSQTRHMYLLTYRHPWTIDAVGKAEPFLAI